MQRFVDRSILLNLSNCYNGAGQGPEVAFSPTKSGEIGTQPQPRLQLLEVLDIFTVSETPVARAVDDFMT